MRIRNYRSEYLSALVQLEQLAARADGRIVNREADIEAWLTDPDLDAAANVFVVTDDDDELNPWGQAGTLDGVEGEIVGYTALRMHRNEHAYHFLCRGTVDPQYRRQSAGRILLVGALNRARLLAEEFEFEAEQEGLAIYFEALLPVNDLGAAHLAAKQDMLPTDEPIADKLRLYRRTL